MALEGNLRDFSLADMFRLIETGSKSGTLHVTAVDAQGMVNFREGRVFHASSGGSSEPVARRLVKAGIISEKQLRQAQGLMRIQKKDKAARKLGQILVDEGYLEASVLEGFIREQVSDALFDLLRWEEGELRFEPEDLCEAEDIGIAIPIASAMSDAEKRLDLWSKILEKIPSMDVRFAMASEPGGKSNEIHLKPREWLMLCHLHGGKSVSELVDSTGYTDFEAARTLYGMYAGGLVRKVGAAGEQLSD